jgi:cell wall-associated NlpC family hydrolase
VRFPAIPHALGRPALRRLATVVLTATLCTGAVVAPAAAAVPGRVVALPSLTSASGRAMVLREARRHLGARYRWGATGPSSFDCSGFTSFVYRKLGVSLPHSSGAQLGAVRRIPVSSKQPGDLIFFRTRSGRIDHVGIYAGGNVVYAASKGAGRVKLQTIYTSHISVGRVG